MSCAVAIRLISLTRRLEERERDAEAMWAKVRETNRNSDLSTRLNAMDAALSGISEIESEIAALIEEAAAVAPMLEENNDG